MHASPAVTRTPVAQTPAASPARPASTVSDTAADVAEGSVLVQAQCVWCHSLAGAGITASSASIAPPLDHVGAGHSRDWLSAALVDACAHHKLGSPYVCTQKHNTVAALTAEQRDQIVTYLLTLK